MSDQPVAAAPVMPAERPLWLTLYVRAAEKLVRNIDTALAGTLIAACIFVTTMSIVEIAGRQELLVQAQRRLAEITAALAQDLQQKVTNPDPGPIDGAIFEFQKQKARVEAAQAAIEELILVGDEIGFRDSSGPPLGIAADRLLALPGNPRAADETPSMEVTHVKLSGWDSVVLPVQNCFPSMAERNATTNSPCDGGTSVPPRITLTMPGARPCGMSASHANGTGAAMAGAPTATAAAQRPNRPV